MNCVQEFLGFCFVPASGGPETSIFGFGEFITALALLVIVYTVSDIRYRFRVSVTPSDLFKRTFVLIGVIGFGVLITELWIANTWLVIYCSWISQPLIESVFGGMFLFVAMTWIYWAFLNPPGFSSKNYERYFNVLYSLIVKGSEPELRVAADELAGSMEAIVKHASNLKPKPRKGKWEEPEKVVPGINEYAHDILLLIANKRLCQQIVSSSQTTAIKAFESISKNKGYRVPAGAFAHNIVEAALDDDDSPLHHEKEFYNGIVGYEKPFSSSIFGDYNLVESLEPSPLDVGRFGDYWTKRKLSAYANCVLISFKAYLDSGHWGIHSYAISRAFSTLENSIFDLHRLPADSDDYFRHDVAKRLNIVVRFTIEAIDLISKLENVPPPRKLRVSRDDNDIGDMYDHLAKLIFEVIDHVSWVKGTYSNSWGLHYNAVWSRYFGLGRDGRAWNIIRFKIRRLLFDEIMRLDNYLNFHGARLLGYCLNVIGLEIGDRKRKFDKESYALRSTLIPWVQQNYLRIKEENPRIADSMLIGRIEFDEDTQCLYRVSRDMKTGWSPHTYLELNSPNEPHEVAPQQE